MLVRALGFGVLLGCCLSTASAQITGYTVEGDAGYRPGEAVCWIGDADGDGLSDWATSDPLFTSAGVTHRGQVRAHSGADGQQLASILGNLNEGRLGSRLAELGDVDGDGLPEFLAVEGAKALVISTATWAPLFQAALQSAPTSLAGVGDVDGDGRPDFAAGDRFFGTAGAAWVHSGVDGHVIHTFTAGFSLEQLGASIAGPGDLDGDGRAEILVGAPFAGALPHIYRGAAVLYRGSNGQLWRTHFGGQAEPSGTTVEELGANVVAMGDVDLDGVGDYAAQSGWPGNTALMFSGASGDLLHFYTSFGPNEGPTGLANAGDADGDGHNDLLISAYDSQWHAQITLRSGAAPFGVLDRYFLPYISGRYVAGRDADGDGHPDLLLGERRYLDDVNSTLEPIQHAPGRTSLIGLHALESETLRTCSTTVNSTGEPARIWTQGSLRFSDDALSTICWNLPPNQIGLVYLGTAPANVPRGNGIRCVGGQVVRLSAGLSNAAGVRVTDVPLDPSSLAAPLLQPGAQAWFQYWFRDLAGGGAGFDYTDAVRVTLAP